MCLYIDQAETDSLIKETTKGIVEYYKVYMLRAYPIGKGKYCFNIYSPQMRSITDLELSLTSSDCQIYSNRKEIRLTEGERDAGIVFNGIHVYRSLRGAEKLCKNLEEIVKARSFDIYSIHKECYIIVKCSSHFSPVAANAEEAVFYSIKISPSEKKRLRKLISSRITRLFARKKTR